MEKANIHILMDKVFKAIGLTDKKMVKANIVLPIKQLIREIMPMDKDMEKVSIANLMD